LARLAISPPLKGLARKVSVAWADILFAIDNGHSSELFAAERQEAIARFEGPFCPDQKNTKATTGGGRA